MRRSQRDLPTTPDGMRDARIGELERAKRRPGSSKDPNPISQNPEPLRKVRGTFSTLSGAFVAAEGAGWTGVRSAVGVVTITFTNKADGSTPFSATPSVVFSGEGAGIPVFIVDTRTTTSVRIRAFTLASAAQEFAGCFIAEGTP